jgi:hypothetical protein
MIKQATRLLAITLHVEVAPIGNGQSTQIWDLHCIFQHFQACSAVRAGSMATEFAGIGCLSAQHQCHFVCQMALFMATYGSYMPLCQCSDVEAWRFVCLVGGIAQQHLPARGSQGPILGLLCTNGSRRQDVAGQRTKRHHQAGSCLRLGSPLVLASPCAMVVIHPSPLM